MTQSNDLSQRVDRLANDALDLKLAVSATLGAIDKNSADIAVLIEVSRRNSELGRRNSEAISALQEGTAALQLSQLRTDEAIRDIRAAIERMDRLFDYLALRCSRVGHHCPTLCSKTVLAVG